MLEFFHKQSAAGRWQTFSLTEQMLNIGAEVGRAARWQGREQKRFDGATLRALELFDLTLDDPRWRGRPGTSRPDGTRGALREIGRLRELFVCAIEDEGKYNTSLNDLERYFMQFAKRS